MHAPPAPVADTPPPLDALTVRDYYAGHALAGILAAHAEEGLSFPEPERAARLSFAFADALLARRQSSPATTPAERTRAERRADAAGRADGE